MNAQNIASKIYHSCVWPDSNKHKDKLTTGKDTFSPECLSKFDYFIVYGDDGGDGFVKFADNKTDFIAMLKSHIDGNTNCDFETRDYLFVMDGKEIKISDLIRID